MTRFQLVLSILAAWLVALTAVPALAVNDQTVLVLHAVPSDVRQSCTNVEISSFDCNSPATVSVGGGETIDVILFVYEFENVTGVQCVFDWPPDWIFQGWRGGCGSNQVYGLQPTSDQARDLATVFDVVTSPTRILPVGWMTLLTGSGGCLTIGESSKPFGTHVVADPSTYGNQATAIPPDRRGSICSSGSGVDACSLGRRLNKSTWGEIKSGYER